MRITLIEVLTSFVVFGINDGSLIDLGVVDVADGFKALVLVNDLFSVRVASAKVAICLLWLGCSLGPTLRLLLFQTAVFILEVNDFFLGNLMVF